MVPTLVMLHSVIIVGFRIRHLDQQLISRTHPSKIPPTLSMLFSEAQRNLKISNSKMVQLFSGRKLASGHTSQEPLLETKLISTKQSSVTALISAERHLGGV